MRVVEEAMGTERGQLVQLGIDLWRDRKAPGKGLVENEDEFVEIDLLDDVRDGGVFLGGAPSDTSVRVEKERGLAGLRLAHMSSAEELALRIDSIAGGHRVDVDLVPEIAQAADEKALHDVVGITEPLSLHRTSLTPPN